MKYFTSAILLLIAAFIGASVDAIVSGKFFDRIVVVVFENTGYTTALAQPYLQDLTNRTTGLLLTSFYAITHPSQPNYIASIYGSTANVTSNAQYNISGNNLVDLLEAKGISWKSYNEDYPGNCFTGSFYPSDTNRLYARKHNPFISMNDIRDDPTRCAKIVDGNQLDADISAGQVPQFVYYVPNQKNDAHDTNMTFAMNWFSNWLEPKLNQSAFTTNTLFVITFDEDDDDDEHNHIFTSLLGSPVDPPPNHKDNKNYSLYSIMSTVEENWDLGNLNRNDATAEPFTKYLKVLH